MSATSRNSGTETREEHDVEMFSLAPKPSELGYLLDKEMALPNPVAERANERPWLDSEHFSFGSFCCAGRVLLIVPQLQKRQIREYKYRLRI